MKRLLYMIGQPGAGKTTVFRKALEGCSYEAVSKPFALRVYPALPSGIETAAAQFGTDRFGFGGTDTLGLAVQPLAERFMSETLFRLVVGEGDRLGNHKFFKHARTLGWDVTVVLLATPNDVAAQRRDERGSSQNPQWITGRITKVASLSGWCSPNWVLDGCASVDELAMRLREHPVIEGIRRLCGV